MSNRVSRVQMSLGLFLQEARNKVGLSQKEVTDILGYNSAQVISDWERGVRSPPANAVRKLVKIYGVPAEKFFEVIFAEETIQLEKKLKKKFGFK